MARWISESQELLKTLEEAASRKGEDRLELVNSVIFALNAMDRSMHGWRGWIQSLEFMSKFSEDELREMKQELIKEACSFVEYDVEASIKHKDKMQVVREKENERRDDGVIA